MKHSIRVKYTLVFSALVITIILLFWTANSLLLGRYYINTKKNAIVSAYDEINLASREGDIDSESFAVKVKQTALRDNFEMLIVDSDTRLVLSTERDTAKLTDRLLSFFFSKEKSGKIIYTRENLSVQRSFDKEIGLEYIELWGLLDNHNMIVIRTPIESIRDSVSISNRFLIYVGAALLIVGIIIANILAKSVTGPIKKIAAISERVARLDFDARYDDKGRKDEIATLGRSINAMSQNMEQTISELKAANNELQSDLTYKTEQEEMRRDFLSNVSHELKTPLAIVQGYAEGLKDCVNDDAESREYYCDVIIDEAAKMNVLVQQLLKLNQLENRQSQIDFERFDLAELVKSCIQSVDILLRQNEIKLKFTSVDAPYVWSDSYGIEMVVSNYLTNAIHYAQGEKVIEVSLEAHDDVIRLQVFNTGEPIKEEELDRIWNKFYKTDKARTREYGGTGIGLSIVKAVAESLNRQYGVKNYDNGVAFWFDVERDPGKDNDTNEKIDA